MRINVIKRALAEVKAMCIERATCEGCPFRGSNSILFCKVGAGSRTPDTWQIDDLEEDTI